MAFFRQGTSRISHEVIGRGTPLLFPPGVTEIVASHADWLALATRHQRVIAAEQPGSGRSGPQPRHFHPDCYRGGATSFGTLLQHLARSILRNVADGIEAIIAAGGDISRSRAHLIRCQVCLIPGQNDPFVSADHLNALAATVADARTLMVQGFGHGVRHDRPDWFTATLADRLAWP